MDTGVVVLNHRRAGASPVRERRAEGSEAPAARDADQAAPPQPNGFHHWEASESEAESAAGSSFASAGPDMSRRKTRSANLDDIIPQQRAGVDSRPHSYAHGRHLPRCFTSPHSWNFTAFQRFPVLREGEGELDQI